MAVRSSQCQNRLVRKGEGGCHPQVYDKLLISTVNLNSESVAVAQITCTSVCK